MRRFRQDNGMIEAQTIIMNKLGVLNIVNPMKPSMKYDLTLKYYDHRILIYSLLNISASEFAEQLIEDADSDLTPLELHGSMSRLLLTTEARHETMKFVFAELGERTLNVTWPIRREQLKRYLVGDQGNLDKEIFHVVNMYKELEKENALARGPIEIQYRRFLKNRVTAESTSS
jgi:hypothetical protein